MSISLGGGVLTLIPKREWDLRTRIAQDHLSRIRSRVRACRVCGCTETDCRQCIDPKTGFGCHWVEWNLCSRCAPPSWRVFRVTYDGIVKGGIIKVKEELGQVKAYSIRQALANARERFQDHVAVISQDGSKSLCSFKRGCHE